MLAFILLLVVSYLAGNFSFARLYVKSIRSINLERVGTGLADTENVFYHVNPALGIYTGITHFARSFLYVFLLDLLYKQFGVAWGLDFIALKYSLYFMGMAFVAGNCLPVVHGFKGGRGIFTYLGFNFFFAPELVIIILLVAALVAFGFKQLRAAQFMSIGLVPVLAQITSTFFSRLYTGTGLAIRYHDTILVTMMLAGAFAMGVLNLLVARKLGEL